MRELHIRGWNGYAWRYGTGYKKIPRLPHGNECRPSIYLIDGEEVDKNSMAWSTGCTDMTGIEIFEDDLVVKGKERKLGRISWNLDKLRWEVVGESTVPLSDFFDNEHQSSLIVVGTYYGGRDNKRIKALKEIGWWKD